MVSKYITEERGVTEAARSSPPDQFIYFYYGLFLFILFAEVQEFVKCSHMRQNSNILLVLMPYLYNALYVRYFYLSL